MAAVARAIPHDLQRVGVLAEGHEGLHEQQPPFFVIFLLANGLLAEMDAIGVMSLDVLLADLIQIRAVRRQGETEEPTSQRASDDEQSLRHRTTARLAGNGHEKT